MAAWFRFRPTGGALGRHLSSQLRPEQQTPPDAMSGAMYIPFDNVTLQDLPVDNNKDLSNNHRLVKGACYTRVSPPEPLLRPKLVAHSTGVLNKLHLADDSVTHPDFVDYFSGSKLFPGSEPAAHCYCGFQYGLFSGQLGDGAVMYIGDTIGDDGQRYEVQLKGSGKTPFSRASTDGRKVLRSSIREMLASEAMAHLGIPTSRVATCMTSDTEVFRDVMYSGDVTAETAAVICRIAPSFLRIGSLEVTKESDPSTGKAGPSAGDLELLQTMLQHLIRTHYPQLYSDLHFDSERMHLSWFEDLVGQSAQLVAQWQAVGFCHGVLNTDNISLVGTTIDYGPYGFMEVYDPNYICNASDYWARYSFSRQAVMIKWCLERLAELLQPVIKKQSLHRHLAEFDNIYQSSLHSIMHKKLGLKATFPEIDRKLMEDLLAVMEKTGSDYSKTLRCLSSLHSPRCADYQGSLTVTKDAVLSHCCSLSQFKETYSSKTYPSQDEIRRSLWVLQSNPELLPKYLEMSRAATDGLNSRPIVTQVQNMTGSDKRKQDESLWQEWLTKYSDRLLLETERGTFSEMEDIDRRTAMDKHNPRFTLRNHVLQHVIEAAENGDFLPTQTLLKLVQQPYDEFPLTRGYENLEVVEELIKLHDQETAKKKIRIT